MENTATPRQRWALYCITKKDYRNEVLQMIIKKLPKNEYNYLKKIGCPVEAIWYQMQNIQLKYYEIVQDFANTKGIKMQIYTHFD